eukprot:2692862-Pleurochrysis_carterae.AAC.1
MCFGDWPTAAGDPRRPRRGEPAFDAGLKRQSESTWLREEPHKRLPASPIPFGPSLVALCAGQSHPTAGLAPSADSGDTLKASEPTSLRCDRCDSRCDCCGLSVRYDVIMAVTLGLALGIVVSLTAPLQYSTTVVTLVRFSPARVAA